MTKANQNVWPSQYEPANCPIHVRNELAITSNPETVWAWLIRPNFGQAGTRIQLTSNFSAVNLQTWLLVQGFAGKPSA